MKDKKIKKDASLYTQGKKYFYRLSPQVGASSYTSRTVPRGYSTNKAIQRDIGTHTDIYNKSRVSEIVIAIVKYQLTS